MPNQGPLSYIQSPAAVRSSCTKETSSSLFLASLKRGIGIKKSFLYLFATKAALALCK